MNISFARIPFTHRILLVGLAVLVLSAPAGAATICRVTTAGTSSGTGAWAAPMNLQTALTNTACSEVWVAAGTYKPTTGTTRKISFNIRPSVAVYGGFAGGESQRGQRQPASHLTTLSGDIGTPNVTSDNSYHVALMDGTSSAGIIGNDTVLDGFTISDGNANGPHPSSHGGGLYCNGNGLDAECSPTLNQLNFSNNSADFGGALDNDGRNYGASSPVVSNVVFDGNHANSFAGAMYNGAYNYGVSSPILSNVIFRNNSAFSAGAMYNQGDDDGVSSPVLNNVTFNNNNATLDAGAMYNSMRWGICRPDVSNVTFSNNTAGHYGGAIYAITVEATSTQWMGNVTFSGNHAGENGGAVYNDSYIAIIHPNYNNVTFSGNSADGQGGAMYNTVMYGVNSPTLRNVILWNNTATTGPEIVNDGPEESMGVYIEYSVVSGGCTAIARNNCHDGNTSNDPKLGPLADNGGFTQTMLPGAGSSAIDVGKAVTCAGETVNGIDQRGIVRPQGGACDIGAVEVQGDAIFADGFDLQHP